MLKKLKGVIIVAIIFLTSVMMPFNIYADTIPSNEPATYTKEITIKNEGGKQTVSYGGGSLDVSTFYASFKLNCILYKSYIGYVNVSVTYSYQTRNGNNNWTIENREKTVSHYCAVYGNSFEWVDDFSYIGDTYSGLSFNNSSVITIKSLSITTSNVKEIESNAEILQDIRDQIDQTVILLNSINSYRQYNFPLESFTIINQYYQFGYDTIDVFQDKGYTYPMFIVNNGSLVLRSLWGGTSDFNQVAIIGVNRNIFDLSAFNIAFTLDNLVINKFEIIYRKDYPTDKEFTIFKIEFNTPGTSNRYGTITANRNLNVIPIFHEYLSSRYPLHISSDFALQYGLSNSLLDNIQIIANGTTSSNQANNDLNNASSEFSSQSDDVIGVEENITNNFESQVQNIDINTGLSGFGGNFMTSATWVRTQFDRLTENNPYGSLVAYGLTLGFALLMLGKVLL